MIRSRTIRRTARLLLGAFIAAFAMVSVHVNGKALSVPVASAQAAAVTATAADESAHEGHCQQQQPDPVLLLCKHHCQSAVQTLDHPDANLPALAAAGVFTLRLENPAIARKSLVDKALRPAATHRGGSPPLYSSTSRLRI